MKEMDLFNLNGRVAVSSLAVAKLLMNESRHGVFLKEMAPILDDPKFSKFARRVRLTKMAMGAVFTKGVLEGWYATVSPLRKERMKDVYAILVKEMLKVRPEDLPLAPEGLVVPSPVKEVIEEPAPVKEPEGEVTEDDRIFLYRDQKATSSVHVAKLLGITNSRVNAKIKQMKHLIPSHFYPSTYQYQIGPATMNYSCYLMGLEGVGDILERFPSIDLKLRNKIYEEYQSLFGVDTKEDTPAPLASATTEVQTELPLEETTELVTIQNDQVVVSSRQIAEHFGKQHKDVLKAISNLECTPEFGQRNFAPSSYLNSQNKEQPEYLITRDGFTFLAMGFNGKEAALWKEKYINAFNQMETKLKEQQAPAFDIPQTYADALLLAANQAKTIETQTAQLEAAAPKVAFVDDYVDANGSFNVRETCKILHIPERTLVNWMLEKEILFRCGEGGSLTPNADYEKKGYFTVKTGSRKHESVDGTISSTHAFKQTRVTPSGLDWLTRRVRRDGLLAS